MRVNLSTLKVKTGELEEEFARRYIGGNGFGARILYDEIELGIDPLGPLNKLVFATGPLCGTPIPIAVKFGVFSKSPLTGIFGESYSSGFFAEQLKFSGYDILIIEGRSEKPVYLVINDEEVKVKDAKNLWGKTCWKTEDALKEELGKRVIGILTIGPAGENLVKFACITSDRDRQAGRTGMGAVMGSKRLKAIVVHGTRKVEVANPRALNLFAREIVRRGAGPEIEHHRVYGTMGTVLISDAQGTLPTRNWQSGTFEHAEDISAETMLDTTFEKNVGCLNRCPVACGKKNVVKDGPYKGTAIVGPEYQTAYALGSNCGIGDLRAIIKANELCDQLGIDTISGGCTVAFGMECYERGVLTKKDTDGIELKFGDPEALLAMLKKIAYREGVGDLLAEGVREASKRLGCQAYALQVKGLECPGYEARGLKGTALQYAVSSRGACHLRARAQVPELRGVANRLETKGKGKLVKEREDLFSLFDSLIVCKFTLPIFGLAEMMKAYEYVTGVTISEGELMLIGKGITDLERLFNVREGIKREDDTLPTRVMTEPMPEGPNRGQTTSRKQLNEMLDEYYRARGWDRITGTPTKEKRS